MATAERVWERDGAERTRLSLWLAALPLVDIAVATFVFAAALVVYILTLTPSLSYNSLDGNELATIPYILGLAHSTGYPLYTFAGKAFTYLPFGDVAHRMNLFSATGAALGSAFLYAILRISLTSNTNDALLRVRGFVLRERWLAGAAALFGALLFAFSTEIWSQAVIAEVYAPNIAMVGLTFLLLLVWARREETRPNRDVIDNRSVALYSLFALAFGLSIGTHLSNLALTPGFVAFTALTNWRVLKNPQFVVLAAFGFGLGMLQFVWLPIKANELTDANLARNTPNDLNGVYNYTLNAFPQFRWAFPYSALPNRLILYLNYVIDNFHVTGLLLALVGAGAMALRRPKLFFLFVPAYICEVIFFMEYAAGDLDVFFIPAHFLFAVFCAFGAYFIVESLLRGAAWLAESPAGRSVRNVHLPTQTSRIAIGAAAVLVLWFAVQPALSLAGNWSDNDQSSNTGINDFYETVFSELPQNATILGQGGVFGYDLFYWRLVYDERPDISIPGATSTTSFRTPTLSSTNTFSTSGAGGRGFGVGGPPGNPFGGFGFGNVNTGVWNWPVIASPTVREDGTGSTRQLTLIQTRSDAPKLFVTGVTPQHTVDHNFGTVTLVGYDIDDENVQAGSDMHLKLYWRFNGSANSNGVVDTKVGNDPYIETHDLGFGNLTRYLQQNGQPPSGSVLVEDYRLIVLSSLGSGEQPFRIRVGNGDWVTIGSITVTK